MPLLAPCVFPGCDTLTIGGLCVDHERLLGAHAPRLNRPFPRRPAAVTVKQAGEAEPRDPVMPAASTDPA
jgi:hypothetical protein